MLRPEEDVEATALRAQGWSIAAIARHLNRDRKTVRAYLRGSRQPGVRQRSSTDPMTPYLPYATARLREDPHLWASALFDEVQALGYPASYPSFTRALRQHQLRPHCEACSGVRGRPTIEIAHPPGAEMQWDWQELPGAPWGGTAHLLVGTLPHSGQCRAVFAEAEDQPHLIEALDAVLRRFGGTARAWRFDHMPGVVEVGSERLLPSFAPVAKHYGVQIHICAPRRAQRKGSVEKANDFIAQRWWRTAAVATLPDAQQGLDRFLSTIGDARQRRGENVSTLAHSEGLLPLPALAYPALVAVERTVSQSSLVAFRGNEYSLLPGLAGARVLVRHRLASSSLEIRSLGGQPLARHALAAAGSGARIRSEEHRLALQAAVFASLTTAPPCKHKAHRPPGPAALQAASVLHDGERQEVRVDLARYAELAEAAR